MFIMKQILLGVLLLLQIAGLGYAAEPLPPVPTPGMVTMVDVGAKKCIPCKMMAPIIEELKMEYAGTASIIFLDVWVSQDAVAFARQAGIQGIPTQIFYDKNGKEFSRHTGYFDKQSIIGILTKLGAKPAVPKKG
jgi:thioredoxin 1